MSEQTTEKAEPGRPESESSALLDAALAMRREHGPDHERHLMWAAIADWLENTARFVRLIESGDYWNTNAAWSDSRHRATTVARAYLEAPR